MYESPTSTDATSITEVTSVHPSPSPGQAFATARCTSSASGVTGFGERSAHAASAAAVARMAMRWERVIGGLVEMCVVGDRAGHVCLRSGRRGVRLADADGRPDIGTPDADRTAARDHAPSLREHAEPRRYEPRPRMHTRESVTDLLALASAGDRSALDRAFPLVYEELRRLARRQLRGQDAGHTLSTTALVHEAYLRLLGAVEHPRAEDTARWEDRRHFFAIAATAMRRILVDHARRLRADKRGAAPARVPIESVDGL